MPRNNTPPIVLFTYGISPWGAKVASYLALRSIPYAECQQPFTWPRPDLDLLNIRYRRIPLMAIGRDIYYDTSLIIEKLEALYPEGSLGSKEPLANALQTLIEQWVASAVFKSIVAALPLTPIFQEEGFLKDRIKLFGPGLSIEAREKQRPEALVEFRSHLAFIEKLLGDGRRWILGGETPSLVDIQAASMLQWFTELPEALPAEFFSSEIYPLSGAFFERYKAAVVVAKNRAPIPEQLTGPEAARLVINSEFAEPEGSVVEDPIGLKKGQMVALFRTDDVNSKVEHRDIGRLLTLTPQEICIAIRTGIDNVEIRVHSPRLHFAVEVIN